MSTADSEGETETIRIAAIETHRIAILNPIYDRSIIIIEK
jgi:hypothetical protein